MSFLRHGGSIGPMGDPSRTNPASRWSAPGSMERGATDSRPCSSSAMSPRRLFLGRLRSRRACLRFTGCVQYGMKVSGRSTDFQRTANRWLTGCLTVGVHFSPQEERSSNVSAVRWSLITKFPNHLVECVDFAGIAVV